MNPACASLHQNRRIPATPRAANATGRTRTYDVGASSRTTFSRYSVHAYRLQCTHSLVNIPRRASSTWSQRRISGGCSVFTQPRNGVGTKLHTYNLPHLVPPAQVVSHPFRPGSRTSHDSRLTTGQWHHLDHAEDSSSGTCRF